MLYKILDLWLLVTETSIEMFLENGSTFYVSQVILLNIVLQRSSYAQNFQVVYQMQIKSKSNPLSYMINGGKKKRAAF